MKTTIPNKTTLFLHRINGLVSILAGVLSISASASQLQYQRLKSFGDASLAGRNPSFHLIEGSDGALYGTTLYSIEYLDFDGVAFRVNKDGSGYTVLHHFGKNGDGYSPSTGVVEGNDGVLYGTTGLGGSNDVGVVFKLGKDGSYTILRSFTTNGMDGQLPGELWEGNDGAFYGTTAAGGTHNRGTIFRLNKSGGDYAVLHHFGGNGDGVSPTGQFIEGVDGALYGVTVEGGSNNVGTVFRLNKDGSGYSVLHHFSGTGSGDTNALRPVTGLLKSSNGALYGTTFEGGYNNAGTIFKLNEDGSGYAIVHHFAFDSGDGSQPNSALIEGANGVLFGTTSSGGNSGLGTVFKLNADGSAYGILHHFNDSPDGAWPASLTKASDGTLYGTTQAGGENFDPYWFSGVGTIFKLNHDGNDYAVLFHFKSVFSDGIRPNKLVEGSDLRLYGTTQDGGDNAGGTAYSMNRDGSNFKLLYQFGSGGDDAYVPSAGLVEGSDGVLYGTSQAGGSIGMGTVFKLNKNGSGFSVLHHFTGTFIGPGSDGARPLTELVEGNDGALYGTTSHGGAYTNESQQSAGTVFRLNKDGSDYSLLHEFGSIANDGRYPQAALVQGSDDALYGTAYLGGSNGWGTVFRLNTNGAGYNTLHHFGSGVGDGGNPLATLLEASDGKLYGTTEGGGAGWGTVFKLNKDGSNYGILYSFDGTSEDGKYPIGGLVEGTDGALYGTTGAGGPYTNEFGQTLGTVFRLNKDGSGYEILHSFGDVDGSGHFPGTGLTKGTDGAFYGTSEQGGDWTYGTVFKLSWPLVITRYERSGGNALLSWSGVPNWPYRIQTRTDLSESADAWVALGDTNFTALDGTGSVTNTESQGDPARFYRIVWP